MRTIPRWMTACKTPQPASTMSGIISLERICLAEVYAPFGRSPEYQTFRDGAAPQNATPTWCECYLTAGLTLSALLMM